MKSTYIFETDAFRRFCALQTTRKTAPPLCPSRGAIMVPHFEDAVDSAVFVINSSHSPTLCSTNQTLRLVDGTVTATLKLHIDLHVYGHVCHLLSLLFRHLHVSRCLYSLWNGLKLGKRRNSQIWQAMSSFRRIWTTCCSSWTAFFRYEKKSWMVCWQSI